MAFTELKNGPEWSASEVREYWAEVKRQGMQDRVIVGGSESDLATVKSLGAKHLSSGSAADKSLAHLRSLVGPHGYSTVPLTVAEAHPDWVKGLVAGGINVMLWTLTRADHYARAMALDVPYWFCNNVDDAYSWLQEHSA
jgi:hypothetical protein